MAPITMRRMDGCNFDCPFCPSPRGHFRLGINLQWGNTSCWTCGTHKLADVLAEISGESHHRTRQILGSVVFQRPAGRPAGIRGTLTLPPGLGPLLTIHRKYLVARGFNPDQLTQLWALQGIGLHPPLSWRLFIPIFYHGEMVSWTTRKLTDEGRRYRNAEKSEEAYPAKHLLFGADYCRYAVVVCEGPFDAMRIGPGAVATMGISYSIQQLATLARYPRRTICFDAEPQAQRRAQQLCDELSLFPGETWNVELDAKDPGCASTREINRLRKMLR